MSEDAEPEAGPRVLDLAEPGVSITRFEVGRGCINMTFEVAEPDPTRRVFFRIVGVEPRMWDVTGPDGLTYEVTSSAMLVRMPLVGGDVEFVEGSY